MAAKVATLCPPLRGGRSLHGDPCGKAIEPARRPTWGQRTWAAEKQQATTRPLVTQAPGGPWPLPPMSDAWNLTVASWPRVSCRVDP